MSSITYDDCNNKRKIINEIDTLPELPKDKTQRIKRKLYKNKDENVFGLVK